MLENINDYITFYTIGLICFTIIFWLLYNIIVVLFGRYKKRIERLRKDEYEKEY